MNKWLTLAALCLVSICVHAGDYDALQQRQALTVARKYSEAVSCAIEQPAGVVKLRAGDDRGLNALYLAYWVGDRGCFGGKGSVFANFALVVQSGYSSVAPVIVDADDARYRIPEMVLNSVSSVSIRDGYVYVSGIGYGDKDEPGWPATHKRYRIPISRFVNER